ncbi:hypothetical protein [Desulfovibrio sp. JC010]|uniref:hypothetical protein n=1 Tax=Desulfovibrio sp. JC010 TaxID=2593641 RepID=UPI0013CFA478|nr:hypothetical protein [Desulfovibrio sp. JC010]NDV25862.1 hypothetical protein [Desulfovibrio sp. JC010]
MAGAKKLTEKFLVALFKRGKAEYLPLSYLEMEGGKVLAPGEIGKIKTMLADMAGKGIFEEKNGEYKLLSDPFA